MKELLVKEKSFPQRKAVQRRIKGLTTIDLLNQRKCHEIDAMFKTRSDGKTQKTVWTQIIPTQKKI